MKSTILIFCLTLLASQLTEATTETAVLDSSGDEIRPGVDYYIITWTSRPGQGGLTLGTRNDTCPFTVKQEPSYQHDGLPVRFYPVDPEAKVVTLNTDTNVAVTLAIPIPIPPFCLPSTVWKLQADEGNGTLYVTVGGQFGNPGPATLANWFKIKKVGPWYQFVFNPDVHVDYEIISGDLGISYENDGGWLGLSGYPFRFVIRKA